MFFKLKKISVLLGVMGVLGCGGGGGSTSSSNSVVASASLEVKYENDTTEEVNTLTPTQKAVLERHNDKRHNYFVDADLSYSLELEKAAQVYANTLAKSGEFEHDPNNQINGYGENLYAHSQNEVPTINDAITPWFDDEEPYYHYEDGSCEEGTFANGQTILCGHYTQVLWQESREVGCAWTQYQTGTFEGGYVYVCKYKKAGNVVGEKPYCKEYSNSDLYSETLPSFKSIDLDNKSFSIELIVEDRKACTRDSNFNSAIKFGTNLSSIKIEDFQIFNNDKYPNTLEFDTVTIGEKTLKISGVNRHIADIDYQNKEIYMNMTLIGETQEYYAVELDWNGLDASLTKYSRQMKAKLYKQ
ncbi:MAG: hypothetical protein K0U38_07225 [Epsilonproteobacteria bacterium]|nr:hypothetical protein [Campylobacterota bacterium]